MGITKHFEKEKKKSLMIRIFFAKCWTKNMSIRLNIK